jgi:hypothetical protein
MMDCEVNSVFRACRHQGGLRQWIAAAAAFTLALHVILNPLALGKPAAWPFGENAEGFVICHGAGGNSDADRDGPVKQPLQKAHCVLCTLTHSGCAVLHDASAVAALDSGELSPLIAPRHSQVTEHRSPTGEYQRGPPTHSVIAG